MNPDELQVLEHRLRRTRANMLGTDDEEHYFACHEAADALTALRDEVIALRQALQELITEVDNESPWRSWPRQKIRAFDKARAALSERGEHE